MLCATDTLLAVSSCLRSQPEANQGGVCPQVLRLCFASFVELRVIGLKVTVRQSARPPVRLLSERTCDLRMSEASLFPKG